MQFKFIGNIIFEVIKNVKNGEENKKKNKEADFKLIKPSVYYVTQIKVPSDHTCERYCKFCIACAHQFECTCSKFIIKRQLCKHIHMIATDFDVKLTNIEPESSKLPSFLEPVDDFNCEIYSSNDENNLKRHLVTENSKDQKTILLEDCKFLVNNLFQHAEKLFQSDDVTALFLFKDKLKSFGSKFETKIESESFQEDQTKKRKLDRQNRYF